jgi:DNA-binding SARP family transcriptional activator
MPSVEDSARGTVVHLLGGPYVSVDGVRVPVPEGAKRLLALVALRDGPVERRQVAGTLWPFGDDGRAAGNLRSSLWRLRRSGIEVLHSDRWSIGLRSGVTVDVHHLSAWADRLIAGRPHPDDLGRVDLDLDSVLLLPGWCDEWTILEREKLRQRMLHALEAASRWLMACGRHAEAISAALVAVNAEPLRESAQQTLIEGYLGEGNWSEAHRVLVDYQDLLARTLRVAPSASLIAIVNEQRPRFARSQVGGGQDVFDEAAEPAAGQRLGKVVVSGR